ncbi:ABC transporter permease [Algivirga pacifica]|uniref:ABC transporter permease n=2 Tax=Algivirga pacifica TaxID=1162670 RepID=A0ABP9DCP0_9BACT
MGIQLGLVALYLEWIFTLNNPWINTLWVGIMILVGVLTTIRRVALNWKIFLIPLAIAGLTSVFIVDAFYLGLIIQLEYIFDARYFIPITGMILGNALNHNIVGLTTYIKGLQEKSDLYYFLLINTNKRETALKPFIQEAIIRALNPMIASMSVMGLISLPGMMTGQILGGSSPATAIKYQIMIMLAIFVGCSLNLFLSILMINRVILDEKDQMIEKIK